MKEIPNDAGICRVCGSHNIDYGEMNVDGESVGYDWFCVECDSYGTEWYSLTFVSNDVTYTAD